MPLKPNSFIKQIIIRVTLGTIGGLLRFLMAYSYSNPQAGSRHDLLFPVGKFHKWCIVSSMFLLK